MMAWLVFCGWRRGRRRGELGRSVRRRCERRCRGAEKGGTHGWLALRRLPRTRKSDVEALRKRDRARMWLSVASRASGVLAVDTRGRGGGR